MKIAMLMVLSAVMLLGGGCAVHARGHVDVPSVKVTTGHHHHRHHHHCP